ncbi:MAG: (2Fe-2S)-binding protein [Synergistales bacterium]|nr:(2Fe-2S)-binding protein [Synergistales bacterium]
MGTTITLTINGEVVTGTAGDTILEVCEKNGIDVPTLCHFPGLSERGACRMCLVEVTGARGYLPACTTAAADGMEVATESEELARLRRSNLELLFAERNHLCMFCEMSGDCELQSLAYRYGMDHVRYGFAWPGYEVDTSREHFFFDQNRCILCRRCVRACEEKAGHAVLGVRDRGPATLVCADVDYPFDQSTCVACGTCLQVCPTGALVDKISAYVGRREELDRVQTTCPLCSVGCAVEVSSRDGIPVRTEGIWDAGPTGGVLCVAGRFEPYYDSRPRITTPLVKRDGELRAADWEETEACMADALPQAGGLEVCTGLLSARATLETARAFGELFGERGFLLEGSGTEVGDAALDELDSADCVVVAGIDLEEDCRAVSSPVKRAANRGAQVVVLGSAGQWVDLRATARLEPTDLAGMRERLETSDRPAVLYGPGAPEGLLRTVDEVGEKVKRIGLARGANSRGIESEGIAPWRCRPLFGPVYVLLCDEDPTPDLLEAVADASFLVVQSSTANSLTERADVVLPSPAWSERTGTYVNTEGRTASLAAAVPPVGDTEPDEDVLARIGRVKLCRR